MNRFISFLALLFLCVPAMTLAATVEDLQGEIKFRLNAMSSITADAPIGCTMYSSKKVVKVNEPFTYAWYSSGIHHQDIRIGGWQSTGVFTLRNSIAGTWTYKISFFGKDGLEYPCYLNITVIP